MISWSQTGEAASNRCSSSEVNQRSMPLRTFSLQGVPQQRRWRKKPTGTRPRGTRNHLERDFTAAASNTKWGTDLTDSRTAEHWLSLCVVLD